MLSQSRFEIGINLFYLFEERQSYTSELMFF